MAEPRNYVINETPRAAVYRCRRIILREFLHHVNSHAAQELMQWVHYADERAPDKTNGGGSGKITAKSLNGS